MITIKELSSGFTIPKEHIAYANLEDLLTKINLVRVAYGKPMVVTSGYRSMEHHKAIYLKMGRTNPPMRSKHLSGQAVDILDTDGKLMVWVMLNLPLIEKIGLWMEEPDKIKRVHFQTVAPKSGNRFFKP